MKTSRNGGLLRLIAFFKLLKAASLIAAGVGLLKLMHNDVAAVLDHWIRVLGLDPGSRFLEHLLARAANVSPKQMRDAGVVSLIYAGLFLVEGIGLWMLKRWAEWVTVIITGSLVPFEAYEIMRRPTAIKIVVLLINLAVVAYLIWRIRHVDGEQKCLSR